MGKKLANILLLKWLKRLEIWSNLAFPALYLIK